MQIARRGVLGLGLAGLAGCAAPPSLSPQAPAVTASPTEAPSPSATPTASASPSPSPTSEASRQPLLPDRADIVSRYEGRTPTQWGLETDGVVLRSPSESVVVTFDACGGRHGSGYDEALIQVLRRLEVPATLFLNLRWIDANPGIARELADDPLFELANHGAAHKPLSVNGEEAYGIPGTTSVGEVFDEVMGGHARLMELTGISPLWFRSGTAHVDDVAVEIVGELGQRVVNFDVNADAGATFSPAQVRRSMSDAKAGSISIGHFNQPGSGTADGMREALPALLDAGLRFARLREVLEPAL